MQLDLTDPELLQRLVRDIAAAIDHRDTEIERLKSIIKKLQRMQFGRSSERIDPDQLAFGLQDLDGDIGRAEEAQPKVTPDAESPPRRRALPDRLPRRRSARRPGPGLQLLWRCSSSDRRERQRDAGLGAAQLRVVCTTRPKLRLPSLQHRGASRRAGTIDRRWPGDAPAARDTPIPMLASGRGRTKTGRLCVYACEQRPWSGADPPAAIYLFAPDRKDGCAAAGRSQISRQHSKNTAATAAALP